MKTTTHHSLLEQPVSALSSRLNKFLNMKCVTLTLALVGLVLTSNGQSQAGSEWGLYKEESGIQLYVKVSECLKNAGYDRNQILVKIVNTTDKLCNVHYHVDSYFSNECKTCIDPNGEYSVDIEIESRETLIADCKTHHKGMSIFAGWAEEGVALANFSGFELTDFQVLVSTNSAELNLLDNKVIVMTQAEFDALPEGKKQVIMDQPDRYIIK